MHKTEQETVKIVAQILFVSQRMTIRNPPKVSFFFENPVQSQSSQHLFPFKIMLIFFVPSFSGKLTPDYKNYLLYFQIFRPTSFYLFIRPDVENFAHTCIDGRFWQFDLSYRTKIKNNIFLIISLKKKIFTNWYTE